LAEDSLSVVGPYRTTDDHIGKEVTVEVLSSCNHHNRGHEEAVPLSNPSDLS
jgi:hypothetical protein